MARGDVREIVVDPRVGVVEAVVQAHQRAHPAEAVDVSAYVRCCVCACDRTRTYLCVLCGARVAVSVTPPPCLHAFELPGFAERWRSHPAA